MFDFFNFICGFPKGRGLSRGVSVHGLLGIYLQNYNIEIEKGRVITNAYCRNQPYHSLVCYRNSGRNETSGFEAGAGKDSTDTRYKAMTILGGSNVSGERIPGGSGNKEEGGTRVAVRPGRRFKLEKAPSAGGETIAQLHKGSGLVVDQVMELPEALDVSPPCQFSFVLKQNLWSSGRLFINVTCTTRVTENHAF